MHIAENKRITTPYGVELRKIRVDHDETQRDMAMKLGVSAAFISFIELGKRCIPAGMTDKIIALYNLSEEVSAALRTAESRSMSCVEIDLKDATRSKVDAAIEVKKFFEAGNDNDFCEIRNYIVSRRFRML